MCDDSCDRSSDRPSGKSSKNPSQRLSSFQKQSSQESSQEEHSNKYDPKSNFSEQQIINKKADDYNEGLAEKITLLAGYINAANYRFLKLVAEFDRREGWAVCGVRSCAHWLNWKCGIATGAARERVRVARALEGLPEINLAFEKGEVSYSKVRAMTRAATDENESFLLMIAEHGTAQHMEKLVRKYQYVNRLAPFEDQETDIDQQKHRELAYYQDIDGMWIVHAKLPAEEGGLLVKTLEAIVDRFSASDKVEKKARFDAESVSNFSINTSGKSTENVSAETSFVENSSSDKESVSETVPENEGESEVKNDLDKESPTMEQRRADALGVLAEHYLAGAGACSNKGDCKEERPMASLKGAERCQLILHVRSETYPPKSGHTNGCNHDHTNCDLDGHWVPPDVAKKLACDASFLLVEEDEVGNVLNIGRRSRVIPPAMSRALSIRDGGCQFPGCCETRHVEGHHVIHWANGGETKLENLVTLCRYHHHALHNGLFFISIKPALFSVSGKQQVQRFADRLVFTNASNGEIIQVNPCKFSPECRDASAFEDSLPTTINAQSAVTHWHGESMDYGLAIGSLFSTNRPPGS